MTNSRKLRLLSDTEIAWISGGQDGPFSPSVTNISQNAADTSKIQAAISIIQNGYDNFTTAGQNAVDNVEHIQIDPASNGRSYVDMNTNTFHLNADEVMHESASYVAADIMHDGDHIQQQDHEGGVNGVSSEQAATQLELDNAHALGLSQAEQQFLQQYHDNPTAIQNRMNEPVNTGQNGAPPAARSNRP